MTIQLDGPGVTIADVAAVARDLEPVELTAAAIERMVAARAADLATEIVGSPLLLPYS